MDQTTTIRALARLGVAGAALAIALSASAAAQAFPEETITLVVNFPAGGGQDTAARLIAEYASQRIDVPVVVTNVTGAGGAVGTRHVVDSEPDGYTLGIIGSNFVAQQYMNENATMIDDVTPLVFFGPDPGALEVRADTGITDVAGYIETLRAEPGSITNGNDAPGGGSYIVAALLERAFDIEITKVPYQGYAPTVAGVLAGEVMSATLPVHQFADHHKTGDVVILGVASDERHFLVPDVPTFREQGFDFIAGDWRALFLPVGVPEDRVQFLEDLLFETMSDPAFIEAAKAAGFVVTPMRGAETLAHMLQADEEIYPVLLDAGLVTVNQKAE